MAGVSEAPRPWLSELLTLSERPIISTFPGGNRGDRNIFTHPLGLTMIAFICTAGPASCPA